MSDEMAIEVVYARPGAATVIPVVISDHASVGEAVRMSGVLQQHPEIPWPDCAVGIFGRKVGPQTQLRAGDRVEIYRPLQLDPKERRRRRARQG